MSEDRVIRINKVLRELNISLERAVDYLKDKGIAIDANPNAKISEKEFSILQNQFAGDKGNKEASKEVSEEKEKKRKLYELSEKRKSKTNESWMKSVKNSSKKLLKLEALSLVQNK